MFLSTSDKPTKLKQIVYIASTIILGLLLSFLVHAIIEMSYLSLMEATNRPVIFYGHCALPLVVQLIIWIASAIIGFFLGKYWWRRVYLDRVWEKKV